MPEYWRAGFQDGYVVHRRSYRETSLLVDVFSREQGMVRLLAKGASRGRSSKAGLLQPFAALALAWRGRGDLPVLREVEPLRRHNLAGSAVLCGLYLNELLVRLLPAGDAHPALFAAYGETLDRLVQGGGQEPVLRGFELLLLEQLGYAPPLEQEGDSGAPVLADGYYEYRPEHGPVPCAPHPQAFRGATLLALSARRLADGEQLREAKRMMRLVIGHALGGKPLKSRELFKYVKFEGN
ncbi:MAG: DNA repair protein RecO [Methylococcaceae bacterium]|nr:DNA repair protein RecO [Methylococcaceae bacterium]